MKQEYKPMYEKFGLNVVYYRKRKRLTQMKLAELVALLKESGIVGAGGAGFPTFAKLDERAKTILLNCAECEPLLKLHRQLLKERAQEILIAFQTVADAVGADNAIIGIKGEYR